MYVILLNRFKKVSLISIKSMENVASYTRVASITWDRPLIVSSRDKVQCTIQMEDCYCKDSGISSD